IACIVSTNIVRRLKTHCSVKRCFFQTEVEPGRSELFKRMDGDFAWQHFGAFRRDIFLILRFDASIHVEKQGVADVFGGGGGIVAGGGDVFSPVVDGQKIGRVRRDTRQRDAKKP
ncbi:MAG: hypothetical protein RMM53_02655, partial [Bacteroidia bacterium]|nr:hypothetical protein [Bacteroidia bacterium]MDW8333097.1 hypothetical protein [Bacteroidia bacterium]